MDWKFYTQLLVTFIVAAVGWYIAHALSSRRDVANERRKLRVSCLLEAYRKLEGASNPSNPRSMQGQLESAIADIQLLGSPLQVRMASSFAQVIANKGEAPLDELLFNLRESLRLELQLEPVSEGIIFLRFNDSA